MIQHPAVEGLGFEGVPPERCMYETLLRTSRIHRKRVKAWGFFPPDSRLRARCQGDLVGDRLLPDETEPAKLPLARLFDILRGRPLA